ncbi:poly(U)-specific endoribonuclease-like isoform X1 [Zingiber officinale]|uniref:poly(U)-specific endoribonuclease-like isoform X1 n=1 Tax=Zingiber officinale TaxID=94328 RepID=UPI001C4B0CF2|nr:poly(U)-specific endoribonuclease-like isoform X1 [Zingiber officinale]
MSATTSCLPLLSPIDLRPTQSTLSASLFPIQIHNRRKAAAMEGLVKGLLNVALDAIGGDDGEDSRRQGEERSRSTWAQVVSSGDAEGEGDSGCRRNQSGARKASGEGNDGDWETVSGRRKHPQEDSRKRPQKSWQVPAETWSTYKKHPDEQEYMAHTQHAANVEPTREELHDLSKACSRLWELDLNRLVPGKDYEIECGRGKKVYQEEDMAQGSLFTWLSDSVLRQPTYSRFCSLLDNYNPDERCREVVTSEEKHEQVAFIEEISRTAPIKYLYHYLVSKEIITENFEQFKRMMTSLWFDLYGRGGVSGSSSAFEHVFVGEIKRKEEKEVSGFHNWTQFYLEEAKGTVNYHGYILPRRRGECPDSETQVLSIQFEWNGILKSVSTVLVGVSPEFEIALYTLCFFAGEEDNHVQLGPYFVNIKCYRLGRDKIGSAFPIAEN